MTLVDPFIPKSGKHSLSANRPRKPLATPPRPLNHPQRPATHPVAAPRRQPQAAVQPPQPPARPYQAPHHNAKTRSNRWYVKLGRRLQLPFVILFAMVLGFLAQSVTVGEICIAAYALIAFVCRIPSRATFLLGLISLLTVIVLLVIRTDNTLAGNFAVYAFLFLVVGTISLALEERR